MQNYLMKKELDNVKNNSYIVPDGVAKDPQLEHDPESVLDVGGILNRDKIT
jgi:hypothetical protein